MLNRAPSTAPRVPTLDGLRALSIVLVCISHRFTLDPIMHAVGRMGVRVFFVISGFIITQLLMKERARTGTVSLRAFYVRRTWRIFPACYAYIGFVLVLILAGKVQNAGMSLVHAVTYTVNYGVDVHWVLGHLWSLACEEQFYLIWPWVFLATREGRARRLLVGAILVVPLLRLASVTGYLPSTNIGSSFHTVADALATGCLLALLPAASAVPQLIRRTPHAIMAIVFVGGLSGAIAWEYAGGRAALMFAPTLANLAIAGFLAKEVVPSRSVAFRLLNLSPVAQIGLWSYSLYLWQQPFLYAELAPRFYSTAPLNYVLAFGLALGSYYLIERPFQALRRGRPIVPGSPQIASSGGRPPTSRWGIRAMPSTNSIRLPSA